MFQQELIASFKNLTDDEQLIDYLLRNIVTAYTSPNRHYHNLQHLDNLTRELKPLQSFIKDWNVLILAIGYHDFVYDAQRQDNEEKSAAYAVAALHNILATDKLERCTKMVLATKTHHDTLDVDTNYFTDADLSILGKPESEYVIYLQQIREEYRLFPDLIYKPARRKVLKHFLQMGRIYKSGYFYDRYELQARKNLARELDDLA
jgi:predicted metal-dependent HD superfamily phosphohydrolase